MAQSVPEIEESWQLALKDEFEADYFVRLKEFLRKEVKTQTVILPEN